ncbi:MAG: outer membrane beta-barrel protein [Acidobacteriaceae bacterium]
MLRRTGFLLLLLLPAALLAQSPRSVVGGEAGLWAGGEVSTFNPDWGCASNSPFSCASNQLIGLTALFDFNAHARWGAEGEARWLHWHGLGGEIESNYLIGPRYRFFEYHRLNGWAKVEAGGGWITTPGYPNAPGSLKGSYFAFAPGGTLDYHLSPRLSLRGDYEYQIWPSFQGSPTVGSTGVISHNNGLTPNGFSVGVAYRFLGQ